MRLTFSILGPMRLWVGHDVVSLGPRQRTLPAALLLRPNQPVSVPRLLERVWERPTAAGPSNLRTYVAAIRQSVGRDRLPRPGSRRAAHARTGGRASVP